MGNTHLDQAPSRAYDLGHLRSRWTFLGEAAGSVTVGLRRIEIAPGAWSTPAHEHGRQEEIFYVLAGSGISWQKGKSAPVSAGDCIVYRPGGGAHSLRASQDGLDVLAFGPRERDEATRLPRLELSLLGNRAVASVPGVIDGAPIQFVREAELGPPELPPEPGPRPSTIVNLADVPPDPLTRPRVSRVRRNLGRAAGSVQTGLQHVEVAPGKEATAQHCHSLEEELFVILGGQGAVVLGDQDGTAIEAGSVISRPAGTGIAHVLRAGPEGMTYLAYGTRDPGDVCYYPRSNKVAFRGIGLIARLERLDYWDGED
ncbi:MAG TPA: cupin domain-containing protein [Solirubrobacteraceae bacterium]